MSETGNLIEQELAKTIEEKEENRRYMAWTALVALILISAGLPIAVGFGGISDENLAAMTNLIDWIYITLGGISGLYVTAKSFEAILGERINKS